LFIGSLSYSSNPGPQYMLWNMINSQHKHQSPLSWLENEDYLSLNFRTPHLPIILQFRLQDYELALTNTILIGRKEKLTVNITQLISPYQMKLSASPMSDCNSSLLPHP
uniref:Uncharacterized protein n=1 Tax=Pelusios castaneus TaxID=367368 RepID=A0A8C8SXV6_9SAUR